VNNFSLFIKYISDLSTYSHPPTTTIYKKYRRIIVRGEKKNVAVDKQEELWKSGR
jgi:hypothetical protein